MNNILLLTLFNVVNHIVQHCYTRFRLNNTSAHVNSKCSILLLLYRLKILCCVIRNCCHFIVLIFFLDIPRHNVVHDVITYVNSGKVSERLTLETPFFPSAQPDRQQTQLDTFLAIVNSR